MTEPIKNIYWMKFGQNLGDPEAQTTQKIQQVFGNDAVGKTQIKKPFKTWPYHSGE